MYPPSPGWIARIFDRGKGAVIAGVVFGYWLGQTMAKGDKNHWHDIGGSLAITGRTARGILTGSMTTTTITPSANTKDASTGTEKGMTADIKHTMALLWSTWEDLPKTKSDLQGYGDNELEILETLSDEAKTLRERCLEERGIRPGLKISWQVHEEILADATRQARRDKN